MGGGGEACSWSRAYLPTQGHLNSPPWEQQGPEQPPGLSEKGKQHTGTSEDPSLAWEPRSLGSHPRPSGRGCLPALNLRCFPLTSDLQPIWLSCPLTLTPRHTHSTCRGRWGAGGRRLGAVWKPHLLSFPEGREAWFPKEGAAHQGPRASCLLPRESRLGTARESSRAMSVSIFGGMEGSRTQGRWPGGATGLLTHRTLWGPCLTLSEEWCPGVPVTNWTEVEDRGQATITDVPHLTQGRPH